MAHNAEPMDIDSSMYEFDDKENSLHRSNVLSRTPCTEKGYEELDVTELNMKLRYSITPTASPMSKSFTANCVDNRPCDSNDNAIMNNENGNLTRSLNSSLIKNEGPIKSQKVFPLQVLPSDQYADISRNALRPLDSTVTIENVEVPVIETTEIDENLLYPSSSSSVAHTPEATTPTENVTEDVPKADGASPIMRGLKSVLSMFRSSQSPIPPENNNTDKSEILSPPVIHSPETEDSRPLNVLASTPLAAHKTIAPLSKRTSPNRESIVFNEDLEKELLWQDETTILFSKEKVPLHKLFFQQTPPSDITKENFHNEANFHDKLDFEVEYMDISYNEAIVQDKIMDEVPNRSGIIDSDSEFLDCESTFTKNKSQTESLKTIEDENKQTKIIRDIYGLVEESPNANISMKASDMSMISTETVIGIVNIDAINTTALPQHAEDTVINEDKEAKEVTNVEEPIISINHQDASPAEHSPGSSLTGANMSNQFTNPDLIKSIETTVLIAADSFKSDPVLAIESNVALANDVSQIIETNKENVNDIVYSPPIVKDIGVKSISQIALIADPRVLLFNIPPQIPVDEVGVPQELDVLNTSPANIPLPDDDDIEKVTISSTTLAHNNTVIIHESISLLNTNTDPEEIEQVPLGDAKETKLSENYVTNINLTPDVVNIELPSLAVEDKLDFSVKKDNLFDSVLLNVETNNKQTIAEDLDIKAQNIQHLTELDCMVDQNKVDDATCVSEMEVISSNIKNETAELSCIGSGDSTITVEVTSVKKLEVDIKENITQSDVNQDTGVIVDIQQLDMKIPEIAIENDVHIKDELEAAVSAIVNLTEQPNQAINNEMTVALVQENQMYNAIQAENINISTSDKPDFVAEYKVNVLVDMKHVTKGEPNANVPAIEVSLSDRNTEKNPSVITFSMIENDENVALKDKTKQPEVTATASTNEIISANLSTFDKTEQPEVTATTLPYEIISAELSICTNIKPEDITVKTTVSDNVEDGTMRKEALLESVKESLIEESKDTNAEYKLEKKDEEIVVSENSSPFVSVTAEELSPESKTITNFEDIENHFAGTSKVVQTPPSSPKIVSKGYNFNFDEIDDPFATKTKIRTTPPPGASPNHTIEKIDIEPKLEFPKKAINTNRRKSQPEKKKPVTAIKKSNASFDSTTYIKKNTSIKNDELVQQRNIVNDINADLFNNHQSSEVDTAEPSSVQLKQNKQNIAEIPNSVSNKTNETFNEGSLEVLDVESEVINSNVAPKGNYLHNSAEILGDQNKSLGEFTTMQPETKYPSSSEQSSYFSVGTSSNEGIESKSVFNLPEIDDKNFNPFMTMTKIRRSPSTSLEMNNTDTTNSSKATDDKDITVREVHTEDEDTVEGPFLETEDFDEDKASDFDVEMMEFNDMPVQGNIDKESELFIDAETFEFLLNQNQANVVTDSGKESLFLKFDPLFAKRLSSEGVLAALSKVQERMSTPKKITVRKRDEPFCEKAPVAGPSTLGVSNDITEDSHEDVNVAVTKPMMVVNPAVNPVVTCRNKNATPAKPNRRSLTFTSPAIAVIDRLLNLSTNNSLVSHEASFTDVNREQEEAERALTQLRELLADKEINVYNLRSESKELKDRLSTLESQMKSLESVSEERLKKINELTEKLNEKTKINRSMASVVEEYERTIASLIAETEHDKKRHAEERMQLIQERDEQTAHLTSMEVSFNDIHSKYEKSKQVILGFKSNEDSYKKSIKDFEENLAKMQTNYELLKQHATSKLNHANDELQKINRSHESEVLKLNALIKRKELHITSLEETLAQKSKANEELTAICDELINKVG